MLVTVKKAAALPAADSNGLSDPYVKLLLDEQKRHSTTIRRSLTPAWNEKFEWLNVRTAAATPLCTPCHLRPSSCCHSQQLSPLTPAPSPAQFMCSGAAQTAPAGSIDPVLRTACPQARLHGHQP